MSRLSTQFGKRSQKEQVQVGDIACWSPDHQSAVYYRQDEDSIPSPGGEPQSLQRQHRLAEDEAFGPAGRVDTRHSASPTRVERADHHRYDGVPIFVPDVDLPIHNEAGNILTGVAVLPPRLLSLMMKPECAMISASLSPWYPDVCVCFRSPGDLFRGSRLLVEKVRSSAYLEYVHPTAWETRTMCTSITCPMRLEMTGEQGSPGKRGSVTSDLGEDRSNILIQEEVLVFDVKSPYAHEVDRGKKSFNGG